MRDDDAHMRAMHQAICGAALRPAAALKRYAERKRAEADDDAMHAYVQSRRPLGDPKPLTRKAEDADA